MKKILLATTAAIGMAVISQPAMAQLELTISGDIAFQVGLFDDDGFQGTLIGAAPASSSDRDFQSEADITFAAKGTADNGLEYGANFVLTNLISTDAQEQASVWLSGNWGWIGGGDLRGANYNLFSGVPTVGTGQIDGDFQDYIGVGATIRPYDSDYSTKVAYYTPEFSGFQAGVSYTPELASLQEDIVVSGNVLGGVTGAIPLFGNVAPGAYFGNFNAAIFNAQLNTQEDVFEVAANWQGEFDQFGVEVYGSYVTGDAKSAAGAAPAFGDIDAWGAGANITFGGFTFGAAYTDNGDSNLPIAAGFQSDWDSWSAGLTYENGPWAVGASYENNDLTLPVAATAASESFDYDIFGIGGSYAVAEGLALELDVNFIEVDVPTAVTTATAIQDLDVYVATFTTRATF